MALTKIKLDSMVTGNLPDANIPNNITIDTASAAPASGLTGNTLASGITASSLTSVGTLTGLTIAGTGVNAAPTLAIDNSSSSSYIHSIEALGANMTQGQNNIINLGKIGSTKNSAVIGYKWDSAGSNDNLLTFEHWGTGPLITMDGVGNTTVTGNVTIGTQQGSKELMTNRARMRHIDGVADANASFSHGDLYLNHISSGNIYMQKATYFASTVQVDDNDLTLKMNNHASGIRVNVDRKNNLDYGGFEVRTNGSQRWFIGAREDGTDNLQFFNGNSSGTVQNVLTLNHSNSSATFAGHVTIDGVGHPVLKLVGDASAGESTHLQLHRSNGHGFTIYDTGSALAFRSDTSSNDQMLQLANSDQSATFYGVGNFIRDASGFNTYIFNDNGAGEGLHIKVKGNDAGQTGRYLIKAEGYGSSGAFTNNFLVDTDGNTTIGGDVTISKSNAQMTIFASNTGDHESLVFDRNTASAGDSQEIRWKLQGNNYPGGYILHEYADANNSTMAFGTRNSGTPTTAMSIDQNTRVSLAKLPYRVNTLQQNQTNLMACFHWDHPGTDSVSFFDFNPVLDLGLAQTGGSFFLKISGWQLDRFFGLVTYRNNGGTGDISSGSDSLDTIVNDGFSVSISRPSGNLIRIQLTGQHSNAHGWDMMAFTAPFVT